jgi:SAM-dependent methyltransferase
MNDDELDLLVVSLAQGEKASHLALDRDSEVEYMRAHKYRFREILRGIPNSSDSISILDIGTTPNTLIIKYLHPNYKISTLDITNLLAERCISRGIEFKVCNLNSDPIPFENDSFDVVIFTEVLEHLLRHPSEVLVDINRVMRSGAKLIFSVPSIATLVNRVRLLIGISPLPRLEDQIRPLDKPGAHGHGTLREYTMKEAIALLESCGFSISRKNYLKPEIRGRSRGASVVHIAASLMPSLSPTIYVECFKRG